jgi:hypothetical protein
MRPRAALAYALAALLAFAGAFALGGRPPDPLAAHPPESSIALLSGAFRPLLIDVLWIRMMDHHDRGEYAEMIPIAWALVSLDPAAERAWFHLAFTLALDVPAFEEDPAIVWTWRRQGLMVLLEGTERAPRSWQLPFYAGVLAERHIEANPALAARFVADPLLGAGKARPVDLAADCYRTAVDRGGPDFVRRALERARERQ